MHQLIFLRHAKAAAEIAGQSDFTRPLMAAGVQAATTIGRWMRKAQMAPEVVLVSPSVRTQQTLKALESATVWDEWPNIDALPQLYMASQGQILELLRNLQETVRSAMVIGHNPGLHELALSLTAGSGPQEDRERLATGYPPASLSEFLVTSSWTKLGTGNSSLQHFIRPQDFI